ncbi:MAG TPA: hypothetical protein VG167_00925 [Verrucomicrobiae bacterium]|nr:hypothetical protein [Verrucomicrobiae bacterium]
MLLTAPVPPYQALASLARKDIVPTPLGTAALQQLGASWARQSFFSAQTLLEDLLQQYKGDVELMLAPFVGVARDRMTKLNPEGFVTVGRDLAKARERAKELLQKLGYQPSVEERRTIKDLSSDGRINLVLETNKQIAQGEAWWVQGQEPAVLDQWPGQELFRAMARKEPRDWLFRWRLAGEQTGDPIGTGWTVTPEGRLIALKNHAIWSKLGSPALFPDALGNPWPPFAFQSGMDVRDVERPFMEEIGLIRPGETVQSMSLDQLPMEEAA